MTPKFSKISQNLAQMHEADPFNYASTNTYAPSYVTFFISRKFPNKANQLGIPYIFYKGWMILWLFAIQIYVQCQFKQKCNKIVKSSRQIDRFFVKFLFYIIFVLCNHKFWEKSTKEQWATVVPYQHKKCFKRATINERKWQFRNAHLYSVFSM